MTLLRHRHARQDRHTICSSTTLDLAVKVLSSGPISDTAIASATNTGRAPVSAIASIDVGATPLPATLPLFAGCLGVMGWIAARKKRKAVCTIAA